MSTVSSLKYNDWNLTVLAKTVESSYATSAYFRKERITIKMYPDKLNKFFKLVNTIINLEEEFSLHLLSVEKLT